MNDPGRDPEAISPWPFVAILVGFKLFTLIMILVVTTSWDVVWFMLATHALWIFAALMVAWAPALFWFRLIRVRARRRKLQEAEWQVEDTYHSLR